MDQDEPAEKIRPKSKVNDDLAEYSLHGDDDDAMPEADKRQELEILRTDNLLVAAKTGDKIPQLESVQMDRLKTLLELYICLSLSEDHIAAPRIPVSYLGESPLSFPYAQRWPGRLDSSLKLAHSSGSYSHQAPIMLRRDGFTLPSHSAEAHSQAPTLTTSMHGCSPVFTNDYILHEIFSYINMWEKATLSRAALVSRAFIEPAIRVLWRNLYSFAPLFKLLSGSIKHVSQPLDPEIEYTLSSEILEDEWARFQIYALYVHSLILTAFQVGGRVRSERLHPSAFPILFRKAGSKPILPHLETLRWCDSDHECIYTDLIPFVTPSLRHMDLQCERYQQRLHSNALHDLLGAASSIAPLLRRLTLVMTPSASVCLEPIAESTALETLRLSCSTENNVIPRGDFPALRTLSLTGEFQKASSLLDVLYAPSLQRLSLRLECESAHDIRSLNIVSTNIADHFGQSLRSIKMYYDGRPILGRSPPHSVSDDILGVRPLFELHELTSIDLYMPHCRFSPSDVGQMALAWPMVQQLDLGYEDYPALTGGDLMHFARCCPDLTSLKLPVVAFPDDVSSDSPPTTSHGLNELLLSMQYRVSSAAEGEALYNRAARWIDRIFPNLDVKTCRDRREIYTPLFFHLEQLRCARLAERSETTQ
ncbi:uncharacterized protein LAESUDRAFT_751061 [Laetiporus sulphureus 93-53]|uniref:F-box domain-containing protein n=1 Tax=Laetiporus sulphureus 93-53 TaxID=1314785 RepID=A0A165DE16_9APHY|nr:uncharacterized protein LAESUDRAFT_751061 [Laetiporus sulphureus 93-53]KZT04676.1 hypothetical protein LAESUDRAFT_751061 [Laetiporus sulphureus 93-53]